MNTRFKAILTLVLIAPVLTEIVSGNTPPHALLLRDLRARDYSIATLASKTETRSAAVRDSEVRESPKIGRES
jgi:hypothetical protein